MAPGSLANLPPITVTFSPDGVEATASFHWPGEAEPRRIRVTWLETWDHVYTHVPAIVRVCAKTMMGLRNGWVGPDGRVNEAYKREFGLG